MKRNVLVFLVVFVLFVWLPGDSFAAKKKMSLGDLGKPHDYEKTIRYFKHRIPNFPEVARQLPSYFNWKEKGVVTPAKDQGTCGSCWAFTSVGAIESQILINGGPTMDLSEQQQVSCNKDTQIYGCCGGKMWALKFWCDKGPMEQNCTSYPDYPTSCPCPADNPCFCSSKKCNDLNCSEVQLRTRDYHTIVTGDENEVKMSIFNDGPGYFRYDVYSDFDDFWHTSSPGAVYIQRSGNKEGGHAVLIIGWDDQKNAWLCKNSWGATTGPNGDGTFWIARSGHTQNLDFRMANVQIDAAFISGTNEPSPSGYSDLFNIDGVEKIAGDFNADGMSDIAGFKKGIATVPMLFSNGDGTFNGTNLPYPADVSDFFAAGGVDMIAGDFDGDKKTDIAGFKKGFSTLPMLFSNGDGTFTGTNSPYPADVSDFFTAGGFEMVVGDFNHDGKTDIAGFKRGFSTVPMLFSNGDGTFTGTNSPLPANVAYFFVTGGVEMIAGNFNTDGKTDIAGFKLGSQTVPMLFSNGDGTFTGTNLSFPAGYSSLFNISGVEKMAGDFNADGKIDIAAFRTGNQTVPILFSLGDGSFNGTNLPFPDYYYNYFNISGSGRIAGDFNGDRRTDFAAFKKGFPTVPILYSNGDGSFNGSNKLMLNMLYNAFSLEGFEKVIGDFDKDGSTDIAGFKKGSDTIPILIIN